VAQDVPVQVSTRLKALEDRVALLDQQQQQHGALKMTEEQAASRLKALEDRVALLDQQQQQGHVAASEAIATRLSALEKRMAVLDQQQQQGGGGIRRE
jgi:hypothetical protein